MVSDRGDKMRDSTKSCFNSVLFPNGGSLSNPSKRRGSFRGFPEAAHQGHCLSLDLIQQPTQLFSQTDLFLQCTWELVVLHWPLQRGCPLRKTFKGHWTSCDAKSSTFDCAHHERRVQDGKPDTMAHPDTRNTNATCVCEGPTRSSAHKTSETFAFVCQCP